MFQREFTGKLVGHSTYFVSDDGETWKPLYWNDNTVIRIPRFDDDRVYVYPELDKLLSCFKYAKDEFTPVTECNVVNDRTDPYFDGNDGFTWIGEDPMIHDNRTYPLTPRWIVVFVDPNTGVDRIEPFANDRDARLYGESLIDTGTVQQYALYRTPNWMYPSDEPVSDKSAH